MYALVCNNNFEIKRHFFDDLNTTFSKTIVCGWCCLSSHTHVFQSKSSVAEGGLPPPEGGGGAFPLSGAPLPAPGAPPPKKDPMPGMPPIIPPKPPIPGIPEIEKQMKIKVG